MTPQAEPVSELSIALGDATTVPEDTAFAALQILQSPPAGFDDPMQDGTIPRQRALESLRSYISERDRYKLPRFPEATARANKERDTRMRSMFLKPLNEALGDELSKAIDERAKLSSDPDRFRERTVLKRFLSDVMGQEIPPENYNLIRNSYAKQHLGLKDDTSDRAVFAAIKGRYTEDEGANKTLAEAGKESIHKILRGEELSEEEWKKKLENSPERLRANLDEGYRASIREGRRLKRAYGPAVDESMKIVNSLIENRHEGEGYEGERPLFMGVQMAVERLGKIMPQDEAGKMIYLGMLSDRISKLPDDQRDIFSRVSTAIQTGAGNAMRGMGEFARSTGRQSIRGTGSVLESIGFDGAGELAETTEEYSRDRLAEVDRSTQLRQALQGKMMGLDNASDGFLSRAVMGAGGSAWTMGASTAGPWGTVAMMTSMAGDSIVNARIANPPKDPNSLMPGEGPDEAHQYIAGAASGIIQGGIEHSMNLVGLKWMKGKMPGLAGIMNKAGVQSRGARSAIGGVAGFLGVGVGEYTEEAAQGATDRYLQDWALKMSNINPDTDWRKYATDWATVAGKEQQDTLATVMIYAMIGGGGSSFSHYKYGDYLRKNKTLLRAVGVPEAKIESITRSTSVEDADRAMQAAFKEGLDARTEEQRKTALDVMREQNELLQKAGFARVSKESNSFTEEDSYVFTDPITQERAEFKTEEEALMHWRNYQLNAREDDLDRVSEAARLGALEFLTGEGMASEETKVEERSGTLTPQQAVKEGIITPEELRSRIELYVLQEGLTPREAARSVDSTIIKARRFSEKTRDGQFRYTVQLFGGAHAMDVFEDLSEDAFTRALDEGFADGEILLDDIRRYQDATKTRLIPNGYEYTAENQMPLLEALSSLSRGYVLANARSELIPESIRNWIDLNVTVQSQIIQDANNIATDLKRSVEMKEAIASGHLPPRLLRMIADSVGLDTEAVERRLTRRMEDQLVAEAMGGFPEVQEQVKGKLPHPETLRRNNHPMSGEVRRLWESLKKPTKRRNKNGRAIDRTNEANAFFLPVGEMVDLDLVRRALNEKGFDFENPADLIDALDTSISYGKPVYGTVGIGESSFSLGWANVDSEKIKRYLDGSYEPTADDYNTARLLDRRIRESKGVDPGGSGWHYQTRPPGSHRGSGTEAADLGAGIGAAFGRFVGFYGYGDGGEFGGFVPTSRPEWIAVNLRRDVPAHLLVGHEMLHALSVSDPHVWELIVSAILERVNSGSYDTAVASYIPRYGEAGALDEVLANIFGMVVADPEFWQARTAGYGAEIAAALEKYGSVTGYYEKNLIRDWKSFVQDAARIFNQSESNYKKRGGGQSSFAISPKGINRIEAAIAKKMTQGPDERIEFLESIRDNLASLTQRLEDMDKGIGPFARKDTDAVGEERRRIQDAIAEAKAIIGALPIATRGRVNLDVSDLISGTAEKGKINALIRLIDKADNALESDLRREYFESLEKLLDLAAPDLRQNKQLRGRLTPETQRMVNEIIDATQLTPVEAQAKLIEIQASIDALENHSLDTATEEEIQAHQRRLADACISLDIVENFHSLPNRSASELAAAKTQLLSIYTRGRTTRRIMDESRRQELNESRKEVLNSLPEVTQPIYSKRTADKGLLDLLEAKRLALSSFHQVMEWLFPNSTTARDMQARVRKADRQFVRSKIDSRERFEEFAKSDLGFSGVSWRRKMNRLLADLSIRRDDWNIEIKEGASFESVRITEEQAASALDGTWKPGWEGDPIAMESMRQALADFRMQRLKARNEEKSFTRQVIEFRMLKTRGKGAFVHLSDLEALYLLQLAGQEQYLPTLDRYGFTEKVLAQLQTKLNPKSEQVGRYLRKEYDAEWHRLNPVFQRLFGMDMPRIRNYAPGMFESMDARSNASPMELLGGESTPVNAMSAGFTKSRQHHMARPRQVNALAAYWSHMEATEYFIAYGEVCRDMRAIFRAPDVRRAIEGNYGTRVATDFAKWIEAIENDGRFQAAATAALSEMVQTTLATQSAIGLSFNLGSILKQFPAALGVVTEMGAGAAVRGLVRTIANPGRLKHVWGNEAIQQRILNGMNPEDKRMLDAARANPSMIMEALDLGRLPLAWADAAFTTVSASLAYEAQFAAAKKQGLTDSQADQVALETLDRVVTRMAQPATTQDKSLQELTSTGIGRGLFLFRSDPRKQSAITAEALMMGIRGDITKTTAASRIFWSWCVYGLMSELASDLFASMARDDDDPDRWSPWDYVASMVAGPISGIGLMGSVLDFGIRKLIGTKAYSNSMNPLDKAVDTALSSGGSALYKELQKDHLETSDILAAALRDAAAYSQLAGVIDTRFAIVPAGIRVVRDVAGIAGNVSNLLFGKSDADEDRSVIAEEKKRGSDAGKERKESLAKLAKQYESLSEEVKKSRLARLDRGTRDSIELHLRRKEMTSVERDLAGLPTEARATAIRRILDRREDRDSYEARLRRLRILSPSVQKALHAKK